MADAHQAAQKNGPKSSEKLLEVHGRGRQDSIDCISGNALQAIAFQAAFILLVSDAGLHRGAAFHPSP